jgi:hypothetical protein
MLEKTCVNPPTQRQKEEPHVGIFWLVEGKLLIDSTPLSQAEPYGEHLTHARSHIGAWEQYQRVGTVPADMEYEESPRGRVIYHMKTRRFTFLADPCILKDKRIVHQIMSALSLPRTTETGTDEHYRCSACPPSQWE